MYLVSSSEDSPDLLPKTDNSSFPAQVIMSDKSVEVRPYECNYTSVLKKILARHPDYDFVLYIGEPSNIGKQFMMQKYVLITTLLTDFGDDRRVFDCGVGKKNQKFYLNDTGDVLRLVERLADTKPEEESDMPLTTITFSSDVIAGKKSPISRSPKARTRST